ncbi:MAG: hypothetical protein BWY35_00683 [Firmicutes bacterium ADurb.Bin248]|nr:MAG: hypothetical protein BWY35_00683 [Firmicutes bacterium ADurb.Bin248]
MNTAQATTPRSASKQLLLLLAPALLATALLGCVEARPVVDPSVTVPAPSTAPTPSPSPSPTLSPTPRVTATPARAFDALGNFISGADHFERYLSFRNVQVYEQEEDTFVDAVAVNDYPQTIVCAAAAMFYDETGELVASGMLQTRDASYILILPPGETTLFAQVDTDMSLTALELNILFDEELGVKQEE